jgi:hypothetical protein
MIMGCHDAFKIQILDGRGGKDETQDVRVS